MKQAADAEQLWREERVAYETMKAAEARFRALPPGERATPAVEYERAFYEWNNVLEQITGQSPS